MSYKIQFSLLAFSSRCPSRSVVCLILLAVLTSAELRARVAEVEATGALAAKVETVTAGPYVCPPCGGDCHGAEHVWHEPGSCPVCGMALFPRDEKSDVPGDVTLAALGEYEGTYEYGDGLTVQIAASPVDTTLYAFLAGARYPLSATTEHDTFSNATGEPVVFARDGSGVVTSYSLPKDGDSRVYRRLSPDSHVPIEVWYPRLAARGGVYAYEYAAPEDLCDGLSVASLDGPAVDGSVLDPDRLREMVQRIAEGAYPGVHSVLVLEDDSLVLEEYFYEYDRDMPHQLRSATKSVVSTLVGIAIDRGLIPGVDSPVLPFFAEEYETLDSLTDAKRRITIRDLLTQRSGLACDDWNPESPGNEVRMGQADDWVKFVLDLPMAGEPGAESSYCSGGVKVLGRIVEKVAGIPLEAFAEQYLFGPLGIGMYDWRFDPDRSSAETFTQISLRPRDMAKLGVLFANGGRWGARRVVSEEWIAASLSSHTKLGDTDYGYLWWRPYLNVPGGSHHGVSAQGNGGQEIQLWPDLDLVIVLTGGNYNRSSHSNTLLIQYVLPPLTADQ